MLALLPTLLATCMAASPSLPPLVFEANRGQADARALYLARRPDHTLFLTDGGALLATGGARPGLVRLDLEQALCPRSVRGEDERAGRVHVLRGRDPSGWIAGIPTYGRVRYEEVYPGVDLVYHATGGRLEFDFVVAPGADPGRIAWRVTGGDRVRIDERGDLVVDLRGSTVRQHRPRVFRASGEEIAAAYLLREDGRIGVELAEEARGQGLVIDPVLTFSTTLGGSGGDYASRFGNGSVRRPLGGIATDPAGAVYLSGATESPGFPLAGDPGPAAPPDAFVVKLAPGGSDVVYTAFLGGTGSEAATIAVDEAGRAYVAGTTDSADFPSLRPLQAAYAGNEDAFLAGLAPDGSLLFSTYLGGRSLDTGASVAVDARGDVVVGGTTTSDDFPLLEPLRTVPPGACNEGWIAKVDPDGSPTAPKGPLLLYSTYIGGRELDSVRAVGADAQGNAFAAGITDSPDLVLASPVQATRHGERALFVQKLDARGRAYVFSTYLGGSPPGGDDVHGLDVDGSGAVYLAGATGDAGFPLRDPYQATRPAGGAPVAVLVKLDPAGALVYGTYFGTSGRLRAVAVDDSGSAHVVTDGLAALPIVDPLPRAQAGAQGFLAAKFRPEGSTVEYSVRLGTSAFTFPDEPGGIAVDPAGDAWVAGETHAEGFPLVDPLQPVYAGGPSDVLVARLAPSCRPPAPVGGSLRLARAGPDLVASWAPAPDAERHELWAGDARAFVPDRILAAAAATELRLPLPEGELVLFRVAGRNACGGGRR